MLSMPTLPNLGEADASSGCTTEDAAHDDVTVDPKDPNGSGGVEVWSIFKNRPFSMNFLVLLHDTGAFRITQVVMTRALTKSIGYIRSCKTHHSGGDATCSDQLCQLCYRCDYRCSLSCDTDVHADIDFTASSTNKLSEKIRVAR